MAGNLPDEASSEGSSASKMNGSNGLNGLNGSNDVDRYGDGSVSLARVTLTLLLAVASLPLGYRMLQKAYSIRLHAVEEYGYIIHEFDPYFNFRAAQQLQRVGWREFVRWFDYQSWYPLGRPVGTTIYPAMQVTAVFLHRHWLPFWFRVTGKPGHMSLNDVCCLLPAWFGAAATLFTGLLALECSAHLSPKHFPKHSPKHLQEDSPENFPENSPENSFETFGSVADQLPLLGRHVRKMSLPLRRWLRTRAGLEGRRPSCSVWQAPALLSMLATMFFMSVVPAHLMRSVAGGFDNESVAMTAMTLTFYLWAYSLRPAPANQDAGSALSQPTRRALLNGALAGLAYFYMVASWGGYVFVVNLIAAHAALLVLLGRHSSKLHAAYTSFYLVGTFLATRVPVVGLTPLRSLEQLGPMAVCIALQLVEYVERLRLRDKLTTKQTWKLRFRLFAALLLLTSAIVLALWPTGYFGPISARVRGLFVKHTRTGNPLVDSVAEHQAAKPGTYHQYLDILADLAPIGFAMVALGFLNDASSFLLVYGLAAYFFSHKMVRLILLTAPIASALSGMLVGRIMASCLEGICGWRLDLVDIWVYGEEDDSFPNDSIPTPTIVEAKVVPEGDNKKSKKKKPMEVKPTDTPITPTVILPKKSKLSTLISLSTRVVWIAITYYLINYALPHMESFQVTCDQMAEAMSQPTILFKAGTRDGRTVTVDDYREAYWWLRDNTPEDARIMAWWDYGYQITAIANRTTIADGNTWNHEHIALLGRALTSPLKEGHRIARHLADYVLLWTGGGGDDLAKSPHLARIANSVYRNMCPGDPTCSKFSMPGGRPSPMMTESLLFRLHSNGLVPGVEVDKNRFKEVYKSKHGKVRIYKILSVSKESKEWVSQNRICDAPGSWFCPGQYPPGLQKVLKEKKDFKQLEDFNAKTEDDSEYQKKYFEHLSDPEKARRRAQRKERKEREARNEPPPPRMEDTIDLDDLSSLGAAQPLTKDEIREINQRWEDNMITSNLFEIVKENDLETMREVLDTQPMYAHMRSKDGRGPMWWAHEHGRKRIVKLLKSHGVSERLKDKDGMTPLDLADDEL